MSAETKWSRADGLDSEISYVRAKDLQPGDAFEGIYEGPIANTMTSKTDYKLLTQDNKTLIVNAAGNLGFRMEKVNEGDLVRIVYQGMKPISKGKWAGKGAHSFQVYIGDDSESEEQLEE